MNEVNRRCPFCRRYTTIATSTRHREACSRRLTQLVLLLHHVRPTAPMFLAEAVEMVQRSNVAWMAEKRRASECSCWVDEHDPSCAVHGLADTT